MKSLSCNIVKSLMISCLTSLIWLPANAAPMNKNVTNGLSNNSLDKSENQIHFYRQRPLSTQGMRFREFSRNPNHVNFSDSFSRQSLPSSFQVSYPSRAQSLSGNQVMRSEYAKNVPSTFVPKQLHSESSRYHFRPDYRFVLKKSEAAYQSVNATETSPQLATTNVLTKDDNPWDKYSFRPNDDSF